MISTSISGVAGFIGYTGNGTRAVGKLSTF